MDEEQEFCRRENRNFPSTDFHDDPRWGRVHDLLPLHTIGGTVIKATHKVAEPSVAAEVGNQ